LTILGMTEELWQTARQNRILEGVPDDELGRLLAHAKREEVDVRQVLFRRGERVRHVYFPVSGLYSLLAPSQGTDSVEVGVSGREGMVGVSVHLGVENAYCTAIVQVPGEVLKIDADTFRDEVSRCQTVTTLVGRYVHALYVQTIQWVACNRLHSLEERFARWLLAAADTLGDESLPLTHDFLAKMLGVRRPSVTLATGALQRAGVIESSRGLIRIVNRPGLEAMTCECYRLVRDHYDRLLGTTNGNGPQEEQRLSASPG
jgi:CRP-like cAMP-binding protein